MTKLSTLAFWSSAAVVAYTYAGYPLLISAWSRLPRSLRRGDPDKAPITPRVSIILAARNEAARIGKKIENLLALDYPAEAREIIVVSDGSSDETDAIVASFAARGVVLERVEPAAGKPTAINRGVARASGEILVFCDARQTIEGSALRALMRPFADPRVGAVSGELHMPDTNGPGAYWRYEKGIRMAESQVDSVVGATGAFYAIRRSSFRELPSDCLLDDVFVPFQAVLSGQRIVLEPEARIFDVEASTAGEFARKARTLAGNFQLLEQLPELMSPARNRLFFQLVSHKLMRLACPAALLGMAASNVVLVAARAPGWPLYALSLAGQLGCYGLAAQGAVKGAEAGRVARLCHTFVVLNAAAVEGARRYFAGDLHWTSASNPSLRVRATKRAPKAPQTDHHEERRPAAETSP